MISVNQLIPNGVIAAFLAASALILPQSVHAQDEKTITPEEVQEYLGSWELNGEFGGNPMVVNLDLFDNRGKVNGLLSMAISPGVCRCKRVGGLSRKRHMTS